MAEELDTHAPESPPITGQQVVDLPAEDEKELDGKAAEEHRGERTVPLAALKAERAALRKEKSEKQALQQQVQQLSAIAEQFKQVEPYLPDIAVMLKEKAAQQVSTAKVNPAVAKLAQRLGVQPETAAVLAEVMEEIADERANRMVMPVARTASEMKAQQLRMRAYEAKDAHGNPIASRETIDQVLNGLMKENPDLAASEQVVNVALAIARGIDPRRQEPSLSETTGRASSRYSVSDLGRKAAELRGISMDRMEKLRNSDSLVLEE